MSSPQQPDDPDPDDPGPDDPDLPHEAPGDSPFAFGNDEPIGETERIAREKESYEAARRGDGHNRGHALGGSRGTTDGQ